MTPQNYEFYFLCSPALQGDASQHIH